MTKLFAWPVHPTRWKALSRGGCRSRPSARLFLIWLLLIVFAALPWAIAHAAEAKIDAGDAGPVKVIKLESAPPTEEPKVQTVAPVACRFAEPPSSTDGEAIVRRIAKEEHFDVELAVAVARRESRFRADSVSTAGAMGIMQLMPATARRFAVDICDPDDNVRGGIRYLRLLEKKYANPLYVLAAYNAGEAAVDNNRGIPLYPETVNYVASIMTDLYGWRTFNDSSAPSDTRRQAEAAPSGPAQDKPETWSQGFVLHVE
jgi:soluble lytic murein transglycosylase-like protein